MSSSESLCTSDEEATLLTPAKRRYTRSLYHGKRKQRKAIDFKPETMNVNTGLQTSSDAESNEMLLQENLSETSSISHNSRDLLENLESSDLSTSLSDSESDLSISDESVFSQSDENNDDLEAVNFESDNDLDQDHLGDAQQSNFLYEGASHTYITSYVSIMLFVMKHSLTKDAFSDLLFLIQTHIPKASKFTTSVYRLKDFLKRNINFEEPIKHFCCETCGAALKEGSQCQKPNCRGVNSKSLMFHDLRIERQLAELFKDESFCKLTLDRQFQHENVADTFKDICDGSEYQRVMSLPKIAPAEKNLTFIMNTDGVALFSSSYKGSLWPVYLAVNELPVKLRFSKKYIITSHLYCQPEKPTMLIYLSPLMDSLKKLHTEGLRVTTPRGEILVRFHLLAVTLDLPARAMVLNMKQFNGKFGCCYCEDEGTNPPNCPMHRYYPYNMNSVPRQHQSMITDARTAVTKGDPVKGIKGASPLVNLRYIDLPKTFVIDWMHSALLGVVKTMLTLWLDASYKGRTFYIGDKMALINGRLHGIRLPDYITRQQRNIDDYKHWKATECREWLLHYSLPVISGIQNEDINIHYSLLVTATFLLNQESVSGSDIDKAEECLTDFCRLFPTFYDSKKQTMNIHLLRHMPEFVRLHGPLFNFSCFGFESMNNHLKNMVHGTRFINDQICFAVGMAKCLPDLVNALMGKANSNVKSLMQRLSKKFTSKDVGDDHVKPLGVEKAHILTDCEKHLFTDQPQNVRKYYRVQTDIGVIYSEDYKRTHSRNSYTIMYINEQQNKTFGRVKYFLRTDNILFAVVRKYNLMKNTLLDFTQLQTNDLRKYEHQNLCSQYKQLSQRQRESLDLVNVNNIRAKCVYMECQLDKKVVSIPSNILEHN